ncbi:AAA family ATPase [Haloferax volcanii]|uniref:AAA family ATPase n=1 Tax=Haloferax volcanii TaxID=2246 RepID=A0A847TUL8_HALVO|nr:AAA family ATPase [Haloferax alexandrinus]NLV03000.1 AAA family ATPase [Haloferax alexandrinus]
MKLEKLDIENFRGIKGSYTFEPEGNNAIIVGPNGSGKSSILEAINYLLTNEIRQLDREGMKSVKKKDVIPNIDATGDCAVSGVFTDAEGQNQVTITRTANSADLEPPKEDLPSSLQRTIDTALQGQHILTRDDLLDLIIAQPGSRREVLSELLDLPDIDERRLALQRTRKALEDQQEKAEASRNTSVERLQELTGSSASDSAGLRADTLDSINRLRDSFGGDCVDEVDPETVRKDIESPAEAVSSQALQRKQPRKELEQFADWLAELRADLPEKIDQLEASLKQYRQKEASEVAGSKLELLELGEEVITRETDVCPLCEQDWLGDRSLLEDVHQRREELHELSDLVDDINQLQDNLRRNFRRGLDHLEYLTKELEEDEYPEVEDLSKLFKELQKSSEMVSGDLLENVDLTLRNLPVVELDDSEVNVGIEGGVRETKSLQSRAEDLDDLSDTEQRYERLKSIADRWAEYKNLDTKVGRLASLASDAETAESAFIAARREVIGEIYNDITDRVETYYNSIHPDESDTSTSIVVTETGADLQKEFYDAGEYPPHSVFSEGHLDSLGLCLHLALADYLQQDEKSLLLLDDVVMSVDQDHRLEIAQMIAEEFAGDYQVIITTHDELWAEQLSSQGALQGGQQIRLREWSFDGGVKESRGYIDVYEQWETVEAAMESDQMERAAHELRYATERMLQQCAVSLGGKVEYDPRLRHTLSDFKDSVSRRLNTLTGRAKNNLDQSDEMFAEANDLDNAYGSILDEVGQQLNKVNRRVHWTPGRWLTLSPDEFEEVFEAHKAAYELLYCDECGSCIRYEEFGGDYHELRCNCREHYDIQWN